MGSVIGYDALCRSSDTRSLHDASRHSTPEHVQKKSDNGIMKIISNFVLKHNFNFKMTFQMIVLQWLVLTLLLKF